MKREIVVDVVEPNTDAIFVGFERSACIPDPTSPLTPYLEILKSPSCVQDVAEM